MILPVVWAVLLVCTYGDGDVWICCFPVCIFAWTPFFCAILVTEDEMDYHRHTRKYHFICLTLTPTCVTGVCTMFFPLLILAILWRLPRGCWSVSRHGNIGVFHINIQILNDMVEESKKNACTTGKPRIYIYNILFLSNNIYIWFFLLFFRLLRSSSFSSCLRCAVSKRFTLGKRRT